jgi:hypothetical protein
VFGVAGNNQNFVLFGVVFFIKSIEQNQGGGNQVTVIGLYARRNTLHGSWAVMSKDHVPVAGRSRKRFQSSCT